MDMSKWISWAGLAAIIGGLLMLVKGAAILLTGFQPPYLFQISPLFLGLGLCGLYFCLEAADRGRLAQAGVIVAAAAAVSAPVYLWAHLFAPHLIPQEDTATLITPFVALSGIGPLVSALLLGIIVWRTKAIPSPWLPLAIPLAFVALMALAILLENVAGETSTAERLIEIPIVITGLAWMGLGWLIRHSTRGRLPGGIRK